ncbi:hypothetical protein [Paludibacterium sp.]|uniref:hypothetical protein n=1 Tax=Paludibacterium sp. TaxID=1917523 RepID=UPI0025F69B70|nr:hypothetical protein [Paludibacterium sp.]MBV8649703.1 hypothetical protein [Paludibacterium sp.]
MQNEDFKAFSELLDAAYDLLGKTPAARVISAGSKALFFNAVKHYSLEQVSGALAAHCREGTFTPVPNDIREQIEKREPVQWISADEAWAQVPKLETEPGILNQVTASALAAAAQFIDQPRPDMNAARMAFRAAYDRLVAQEKLANRPPRHWVSPGGTLEQQNEVREEGIRLGLLNSTWAPAAAPQLGHSNPPPGALEALVAFRPKTLPPPEAE